MMGLILTLLAISACTVSGAPMQPRQAEAAVPDLLDTVATTTTASAAPTESAGVESVSPMAALASSFAQLSPASVIAPAVSVSADTDAASVDARQTVLNLVLAAANHVASSPAMGAMTPSLSALVDAHQAYIQAASSSSGRRDANEVSAAAKAVYIAVLNHAVTSEGTAMVSTLASSNPTYQQADAAAGVNRTDECAQMQQHFQGQLSQIPSVVTTHMCDNSTSYSLARMHLAAYAHNSTQFTESTGDASSIAALAQSVTNGTGVVKDATANLDSGNSWQPNSTSSDRRRGTGFNGYDPATGEISAGVCLGEGFELCLKGGGYLPNFKYLTQSITGADEMMIEQCVGGKCSQVTPLEFASSAAAQAANVGIEVSVSVCLGIPGLIDVLNYLGISLCYNLLVADFYGFQGPLGQLSTGLQLFIVKLSAFGKLKMANASPVCPQDFNSDMMSYACRNQDVYDAFVNQFAGNDYCNLAAGHGLLGASIVLDLWFWSKEWDFEQTPTPRTPFTCTASGQVASTGGGADRGDFTQFDCYEARAQYLADNQDVARDLVYGSLSGARQHFTQHGQSEGRAWKGQLCLFEQNDCYRARETYFAAYPDVANHPVFKAGGAPLYNSGARNHFNQWGQGEGRYWHGDQCVVDEICDAANADYLSRYTDIAQSAQWASNPRGHYEQVGKEQLRTYNGQLCIQPSAGNCQQAVTKYLSDYVDVKNAGVDPVWHYQNYGQHEARYWHGELCIATN